MILVRRHVRHGSDKHYPEEAPVHRVTVDSFFIDRTPVTNRQFKEFVKATGHVTFAQIPPIRKTIPALPHMLYAGSLVFVPPSRQVDLRKLGEWWTFLKAPMRHPLDQRATSTISTIIRCARVVRDAIAYARWVAKICRPKQNGSSLRGRAGRAEYAWARIHAGASTSNTWQGEFPRQNLNDDGFERTSPVTAFRRTATAFTHDWQRLE